MNVVKWTIGCAVIALGASPVLAQSAIQTAFNYDLDLACHTCADEPSCGCEEPGCCCEEPSCCCEEPSCGCEDECGDSCCGDDCCGDGCGDACGDGCCSTCGLDGLSLGKCCLGDAFTLSSCILGDDAPFDFGGWISAGYHSEQTPLSNDFGDVLAFNDVPDQLNLHQAWMWFERVADGSCGVDFGFRFDVMYGTDAQKTQAFGNDDPRWDLSSGFVSAEYGWAMPQAYVEVASGDWSVIAGHFYTLIGYEVVTAPDNFFYSHALTMFNSEPFTHTGVLATYSGCENLEIYAGWTLGWDTGFDQYTQNGTSGSSFLGGFSTNLTDDVAFTYITTFGDFGARSDGQFYATSVGQFNANAGVSDDTAYSHSLVFDVAVSDSLNYVLQSDIVSVRDGVGHDQVGINQYLIYTMSDCLAAGTRLEWWKNDGQSFNAVTFGMNYRPHANLVVRPEIRYDWTPTRGGYGRSPSGAGGRFREDETTFGIDAVLTF